MINMGDELCVLPYVCSLGQVINKKKCFVSYSTVFLDLIVRATSSACFLLPYVCTLGKVMILNLFFCLNSYVRLCVLLFVRT